MVRAVLSDNFVIRAPTREDAQGITDMIVASNLAILGHADFELNDLLEDWSGPNFNFERDARMVVTLDGRVVGYETLYRIRANGRILADGYIDPDYTNQGIGTCLLQWAESRAADHISRFPDDLSISLQVGVSSSDTKAPALFQTLGFSIVRQFWSMVLNMVEPPAAPTWAEGITVRTFVPGEDDRVTWETITEAFKDHWGSTEMPFGEWMAQRPVEFDPTLWFLAVDGEQIVGLSLCSYRIGGGSVRTLAVLRPWRRKGVGLALLQHTFGEFYRRGVLSVNLDVDTQNLTGATRLYERAGMQIVEQIDTYGKELRAGRSMI